MISSFKVSDAAARTQVIQRLRSHGYKANADHRLSSSIVQVKHDWEDDLDAIKALVSIDDPSAEHVS